LVESGLTFLTQSKAQDMVVADQQRGLTSECEWLEFARSPFGKTGNNVSACWFFDGSRIPADIHIPDLSFELSTPPGCSFEGSLSDQFGFVPTDQEIERLQFLRK
jgi:hypothetical protein